MKKTTDMLRQYAAANSSFRRKVVMEQLGLSANQVKIAVDNLMKAGWIKRTGHGIYQFQNRPIQNTRPSPINDRLWRAMRANPKFSATDVARQAGTTRNYANKCLKQYLGSGHVRRMGQRPTGTGSHETVWMLTQKGKRCIERPPIQKFEPDPLVVKAVSLNRLVCTGAAVNNTADGATAVKLCREIIEAISKGQ